MVDVPRCKSTCALGDRSPSGAQSMWGGGRVSTVPTAQPTGYSTNAQRKGSTKFAPRKAYAPLLLPLQGDPGTCCTFVPSHPREVCVLALCPEAVGHQRKEGGVGIKEKQCPVKENKETRNGLKQ